MVTLCWSLWPRTGNLPVCQCWACGHCSCRPAADPSHDFLGEDAHHSRPSLACLSTWYPCSPFSRLCRIVSRPCSPFSRPCCLFYPRDQRDRRSFRHLDLCLFPIVGPFHSPYLAYLPSPSFHPCPSFRAFHLFLPYLSLLCPSFLACWCWPSFLSSLQF
jgi:hypothetical protein